MTSARVVSGRRDIHHLRLKALPENPDVTEYALTIAPVGERSRIMYPHTGS
jgi:hypothetical protein